MSKWNKVKDINKVPLEIGDEAIGFWRNDSDHKRIGVVWYVMIDGRFCFWDEAVDEPVDVTHWMPMPEAP